MKIDEGAVFWVLWAATTSTMADPKTHAANLYMAFKNFYPLASDYDRTCIKGGVRPVVCSIKDYNTDEATEYFLERVLGIIDTPKEPT